MDHDNHGDAPRLAGPRCHSVASLADKGTTPTLKPMAWLGRIRTIATPLDRHKATREITWGLWVRTIVTPLDRHKATREITWGLCVQTIVTPLDTHKATREINWGRGYI